jgi:hypothetical protein
VLKNSAFQTLTSRTRPEVLRVNSFPPVDATVAILSSLAVVLG